MPNKVKRTKKKTKRNKIKNKCIKSEKVYKEYGPGLKYLIFDGKKNVFKFVNHKL